MANSQWVEPRLQTVTANGVSLQVATAGSGPLCVLVHGWPELWLSWRHQFEPLVRAGYRVAALDVRGYGGSDAPADVGSYAMTTIVDDIAGVIEALGERSAILIGHDWGAPIVWNSALLRPDHVEAVVGMSVPHLGRNGPMPPTQLLRALYQDRFFYMLYFQQPGVAEAEFEADVRDALVKIYYANSGDVSKDVRAAIRRRTPTSGYLDGMVAPDPLPAWLPEAVLARYVEAYERSGFRGGLNRYRNLDDDWHALPQLDTMKVKQPALFIAGEHDSVLRYAPGMDMLAAMDPFFEDLRGKVIVRGAGHWVQQERPEPVNESLLKFLAELRQPSDDGS